MPTDPLLAQLRLELGYEVVAELQPVPQGMIYKPGGPIHRITVTLKAGDEVIHSTHLDIPGAIYDQHFLGSY